MDKRKRTLMDVNWEQQKVISNPFRSRMIAILYEKPMTPKDVADEVGENPGTVYYHMQQLLKHDIIEVDSTRTEKGIVQKLYRAKANYFRNPEQDLPKGMVDGGTANMYLSEQLLNEFSEELKDLLYKYGHLSYQEKDTVEQIPYAVEYTIKEFTEEDE